MSLISGDACEGVLATRIIKRCASSPSHIDLACSRLPPTERVSGLVSMTTTSVTFEIRLAIQYLGYTRGDPEVILHLSQLLGVIFILAERDAAKGIKALWRQRRWKEKNLETRECASLLFVHSCLASVDGCVLILSVSSQFACLCLCVLGCRRGRVKSLGGSLHVWEHRGTNRWHVGTSAKVNVVTGGYSISSC